MNNVNISIRLKILPLTNGLQTTGAFLGSFAFKCKSEYTLDEN